MGAIHIKINKLRVVLRGKWLFPQKIMKSARKYLSCEQLLNLGRFLLIIWC